MPRFKLVTWEEVVGYVYELARSISESGYKPDVIIAVGREGLAAARLLSEFLGVEEVALPGASLEGRRVLVAVDNSRSLTREKLRGCRGGEACRSQDSGHHRRWRRLLGVEAGGRRRVHPAVGDRRGR